ncbi:hypothetical protein [Nocardia brasiliensis]|uniref:hypothetical protein n=1 Tax=Nocardia brasiliensis TaxID=37326 RepID=UPI002455B887|nr:hypothetical protein [Nocardia brasiliensis]
MTLHITSTVDGEATWWIAHRRIWMESLRDCRNPAPAFRVRMDGSRIEIPNGTPGLIYFGEGDERPELPFVEELFPEHLPLCHLVEAAYWDVVHPLEHLRLQQIDPAALDYTTDQWTVAELREFVYSARQVA